MNNFISHIFHNYYYVYSEEVHKNLKNKFNLVEDNNLFNMLNISKNQTDQKFNKILLHIHYSKQ